MAKKVLNTKELITIKKGTAGKKLIKVIVLIAGAHIAFKTVVKLLNKMNPGDKTPDESGILKYSVVFNGRSIKVEDETFKGAVINNLFGGIKLDLGSAIIDEDVAINCKNIMSGVSIIVPDKVKVELSGKSFMSGISNRVPKIDDEKAPIIHIYADSFMSGIEVKVKDDCWEEELKECCDAKGKDCCDEEHKECCDVEIKNCCDEESKQCCDVEGKDCCDEESNKCCDVEGRESSDK